ncbi:hypothetical protein PINS_up015168 [Pythium insidiosum]|nr:hypothetical protein PINS_up015168 [Pythium insidiosum]
MDNEDDASTEQEENDDATADEPVSNVVTFNTHVPDSSVEKTRPVTATMGSGLEKAKNLIIARGEEDSFAFRRNIRRRKPATLGMDSPLSVIKQRKPISYDEYERLSTQLRGLVEPSGLAAPTTMKADKQVSSFSALTREREISGDLEYPAKRPRPTEERPIALALPREDRVSRKPRPSRLLTGAKRDLASRSAYSAAVAEKILSTLNKIQTPLEQETQKPITSTSMSWAKHHLAMTKSVESDSDKAASLGTTAEAIPPTATIPKIAFPVSETSNDRASLKVTATSSSPLFASTTTSESVGTRIEQGEVTPKPKPSGFFTTPSVSLTPASSFAVEEESKQTHFESGRVYKFSPPIPSAPVTSVDDEDIVYCFSSPPASREPPRKAPAHSAPSKGATASPFSLIPASPRVKPESLTKSTVPKVAPAKKLDTSAPAKNITSGANPLARFMQPQAGSWKCPSCSVTNAEDVPKCPCCETPKPSQTEKAEADNTAAKASDAGSNPLARFMTVSPGCWKCPTCAVTNQEKDSKCPCCESAKPVSGSSVTEPAKSTSVKATEAPVTTGFSFGIPKSTTETAKSVNAEQSENKAPKFTFGVTTASKVTSVQSQPSSASVSTESKDATKPSFSFGVVPSESTESASKPAFSFGVVGSTKRKADDSSNQGSDKRQNVVAPAKVGTASPKEASISSETPKPSFSFGGASAAADTKKAAFSFGTSNAGDKVEASGVGTGEAAKTPAFSFGSKPVSGQPQTANALPTGAGVSAKGGAESKTPSFSFGTSSAAEPVTTASSTSSDQTVVAKPAFTFGSNSAPAPSVSTGFSASSATKESNEPVKPAFTFGSSSKSASSASEVSKMHSTAPGAQESEGGAVKPAFTFGSTKSDSASIPPSGAKSAAQDVKPAAFSFGSAAKTETPSTAAPAFTFGQSGAPPATSSNKPAFTFGAASTAEKSAPAAEAAPIAPVAPSAPAFTFGASGGAPSSASFSFGGQSAPNPSTSQAESGAFGKTDTKSTFGTTNFGAAPATTPSFGTTPAPTPSSFGGSQPAFTFGATSQAPSSTTSFGFGATTSTASTAFGSSSDVFSTSTSSAPAFGSSTTTFGAGATGFNSAPSSGFGSNPSTTFGASTTGFGASPAGVFGSTAPQNTFGAAPAFGSTSQPAFGSTTAPSSTVPTFGSSAAPALSTPGFGAPASSTGFGAPAFGTPSPGFGAPAPSPSPGFGAAPSGFGASPAGGFGAPASNGFGAVGDAGAFAMGAAPSQAPKGRRILKARSSRGAAKK